MRKNLKENPKMISINAGKYSLSFCKEKIDIEDFEVSKYPITLGEWKKYMGYNPTKFEDEDLSVVNITWIEALKFCNELSKAKGLPLVYEIKDDKLVKVNYFIQMVEPDKINFVGTQGYRLPTEAEWECFIKNKEILLSKKENEFELRDCIEPIWEWCYDTLSNDNTIGKNGYTFDKNIKKWIIRNGFRYRKQTHLEVKSSRKYEEDKNEYVSFRVVKKKI